MDLHGLALRELPPPPARVLEVGCGNGRLALALAADGFDVLAVDPKAPSGGIFRQTTIEELGDEGPFDAAVASLSLHHVADLGVAIGRVHSLLRPGGPFVVREFAWDHVDEPTARWDYRRRGKEGGLAEWRGEHHHLTASRLCARRWIDASASARSPGGRTSPSTSRARATRARSAD